ncbi:MAG: hypothetical protein AB8G05_14335 [Oligoflexales bacterium]
MGNDLVNESDDVPCSWHLLSAFEPSFKSSIGAHTINISLGLQRSQQDVHVWFGHASGAGIASNLAKGVIVHALPGGWDEQCFDHLEREFATIGGRKRILIQYTPDAFGDALNLPLQSWMEKSYNRGDRIGLVVHRTTSKAERKLLALGRYWKRTKERAKLKKTIGLSQEIFVSTPNWIPLLQGLSKPKIKQIIWLPVPSNVLWMENRQRAINLRKAFAPHAKAVIGTFGSFYDKGINKKIRKLIPGLLSHPDRVWLFLGRGSDEFVVQLKKDFPQLEAQLEKAGELDMAALSAHLQACDLMVQPYPRGVDTSRTSAMVGLSHGKPIITTLGPNTEMIWEKSSCVKLVPVQKNDLFLRITEDLIISPQAREALSKNAIQTYKNFFSLDKCIDTLLTI